MAEATAHEERTNAREAQSQRWLRVAADLKIQVVAPFSSVLPGGAELKAAALIRNFGAEKGMVVDADYAVLKPFTEFLRSAGYGYSAVEIGHDDRAAVIGMLRDWGWTGEARDTPNWLRSDRPSSTSPT